MTAVEWDTGLRARLDIEFIDAPLEITRHAKVETRESE